MSAIIVPVGDNQSDPRIGNVEAHRKHLEKYDKVFWNFSPGGDKSNKVTQWKHPNIGNGYFYFKNSQTIDYKFTIEYVKLIRELDIKNTSIKNWIPSWRNKFFDPTVNGPPDYDNNAYAILITNIIPLNPPKHKTDFVLESLGKSPKTIRNAIFVEGS